MRIADQAESAFRVLVHSARLRADRDGGVGEGGQGIPVSGEGMVDGARPLGNL